MDRELLDDSDDNEDAIFRDLDRREDLEELESGDVVAKLPFEIGTSEIKNSVEPYEKL